MQSHVRNRILELTEADAIVRTELIQPLWNNYGTLSRLILRGGLVSSVIVKHIQIPDQLLHPRGFASSISRDRKVQSYQVETRWYQHQNQQLPTSVPTPRCLDAFSDGGELFLLLEDLATRGFTEVIYDPTTVEIGLVLTWLAHFHAQFVEQSAEGLWSSGTYWHLETRPEELANIEGTPLHLFAGLLAARLRCGRFPTLVHGDAKLANFLFRPDRQRVAAVDFQYVGQGAAMKDVAYFIGSCLSGPECERRESELLSLYFERLREVLPGHLDGAALETEWRSLYPVAWADFQRFMTGWSPGHRKLTHYSDATTERALISITQELMAAAREACLAAGEFIQANRNRPLEVSSKGMSTRASDVVTEIDIQAQSIILERLKGTIERYDLGLLAEEGESDDSRLQKHAFWTVDPLDGTQYFVEGRSGYATSIALVTKSGRAILGVVYDPVQERLYEAISGRGVSINGVSVPIDRGHRTVGESTAIQLFADRSLRNHPKLVSYQSLFEIHYQGGAVMNALSLLTEPNSTYIKAPKTDLGGCAIWDLAAVTLMLTECGGQVLSYAGAPLSLNRPESVYFNDVGFVMTSPDIDWKWLSNHLDSLER